MPVIAKDVKISFFVAVLELFINVTNSNLVGILVIFSFVTCLLVLKFALHGHSEIH